MKERFWRGYICQSLWRRYLWQLLRKCMFIICVSNVYYSRLSVLLKRMLGLKSMAWWWCQWQLPFVDTRCGSTSRERAWFAVRILDHVSHPLLLLLLEWLLTCCMTSRRGQDGSHPAGVAAGLRHCDQLRHQVVRLLDVKTAQSSHSMCCGQSMICAHNVYKL